MLNFIYTTHFVLPDIKLDSMSRAQYSLVIKLFISVCFELKFY
jgi:hypothetical protein